MGDARATPVIPEFREAKYPESRAASGTRGFLRLGPGSRAVRLAGMTALVRERAALFFFLLVVSVIPAAAVQPDEVLKDPALEARARSISQELRCLVCQNQSIDDSNAELARDLRVIVRERLSAGDNDAAVLAFVEKRYGEFVLLRPRLAPHTLILWLAPLLLLSGAGIFLWRARSQSRVTGNAAAAPLSAEEQRRLDALLDRDRENE
jgi:cytochrome c-type biogenesis protein CcmH